MNQALSVAIVVLKTVILVLGGTITYFAFKASRERQSTPLRALTVGFGLITVGALLAGVAHQLLMVSLAVGVLINSFLTTAGFVIITYSLYID